MSNADSEHDPFNEPELANPRARELMREEFFWDCVDEEAPFGSDEGNTSYHEFRAWRRKNKKAKLTKCFAWIMQGEELSDYNETLCTDEIIERDLDAPEAAFLGEAYDMFTLDTTIISTALSQLLDEGR